MNKMIRHTASLLAALMLLPSLGACARMAGTEDRLPALTDDISVSVSDTVGRSFLSTSRRMVCFRFASSSGVFLPFSIQTAFSVWGKYRVSIVRNI